MQVNLACPLGTRVKMPFFIGRRGSQFGQFSFLMVRWVDMLFWFLELYWFQKGAIEVDYSYTYVNMLKIVIWDSGFDLDWVGKTSQYTYMIAKHKSLTLLIIITQTPISITYPRN